MRTCLILFVYLAGMICSVFSAPNSDPILDTLSGVKNFTVKRTDFYWDLGSIGVSLLCDNEKIVEIRAINPHIKPDKRFFLFSTHGWAKGIPIDENSEPEKRIIELLSASHSDDERGNSIIDHLRTMIVDRNTPWKGFDWHTTDYLKEQFQCRLNENEYGKDALPFDKTFPDKVGKFYDSVASKAQISVIDVDQNAIKAIKAFPAGALFVIQDALGNGLHKLAWKNLAELLNLSPNPLKADIPVTVVILIPLFSRDDILNLVSVEKKAYAIDFEFSHFTRKKPSFTDIVGVALVTLPIGAISQHSCGFNYGVNSARCEPPPEGYQSGHRMSSGTGCMFK